MPLASFRIVSQAGEPPLVVEVNGAPLPDGLVVTGVSLATDGGMPRLVLSVSGEAVIEGEGVVYVRPDGGDEIAYLQQWVANLDPGEIQRLSLELLPPTLDTSMGDGVKAALLHLAGVESPHVVRWETVDGQRGTVPAL